MFNSIFSKIAGNDAYSHTRKSTLSSPYSTPPFLPSSKCNLCRIWKWELCPATPTRDGYTHGRGSYLTNLLYLSLGRSTRCLQKSETNSVKTILLSTFFFFYEDKANSHLTFDYFGIARERLRRI